jgi:two-component system CheB/CheR fusion protein
LALAGLVNRREFEHRLARVLESTRDCNVQHALCYLDLDQFKLINDSCGHLAGDELLQQIAGVLKEKVRKRDTIARYRFSTDRCHQLRGQR